MDTDDALRAIRDKIELHLAGECATTDLIRWALEHPLCLKGEDFMAAGDRTKGRLLNRAFATILACHPDEPTQYRETDEDLREVVSYIEGKKPFLGVLVDIGEAGKEGGDARDARQKDG
jgi:hypothetical protein